MGTDLSARFPSMDNSLSARHGILPGLLPSTMDKGLKTGQAMTGESTKPPAFFFRPLHFLENQRTAAMENYGPLLSLFFFAGWGKRASLYSQNRSITSQKTGTSRAGSKLPTRNFLPKATLQPTAKISTLPTIDRFCISESLSSGATHTANRVINP